MRQKLLLLAAVFFGILAFVLTYKQIQAEKAKISGEAEYVYLININRDMAGGEEIKSDYISKVEIKRLRNTSINFRDIPWDRRTLIIGRKLENSKQKNQILQWDDLKPASRQNGFTGRIQPGYRAISIPVDTTSSVTNLIQPDDNVDIIGTFRFPEMRGDNSLDTITLTILQNVKILATGNNWRSVAQDQQGGGLHGYSTVTLMLSPEEVEMIIFASQKGRLSLSLRNIEETKFTSDLQSVNFKFLEKNIPVYNEKREQKQRTR
ncbi:MAG: Flp pilus assembly protein CpaB [Victivallaceae bacterium]